MTDRNERLRQAARARHDATLARASASLRSLACAPEPITFSRLARVAGVSRSWLYRQPELRRQIDQLRQSSSPPSRSRASVVQRASADSNREKLTIYRQELTRLQAENRDLREQLARRFGAERAAAILNLP